MVRIWANINLSPCGSGTSTDTTMEYGYVFQNIVKKCVLQNVEMY